MISRSIVSWFCFIIFIGNKVEAQITKTYQLPSNNGESCNVVNLNLAGEGDANVDARGQPGGPGKRGQMGPIGPVGPRGEKGERGMKGETPAVINTAEITSRILKALRATSCREIFVEHGISDSEYYLLRRNNTASPEYVYCDFQLRAVSECWELTEEISFPKVGYYLFKSNSSSTKEFVHCTSFQKEEKVVYKTCQNVDRRDAKVERTSGGVFDISLVEDEDEVVEVYCDLETDGGGWTVFQRREDGSVEFYRNWDEYVNGFGDKDKEMWLGLETIHQLTKNGTFELRIDLTDWGGSSVYAKYNTFSIESGSTNYRLRVGGYSGNAGDSLAWHNGQMFTTKDVDNDSWNKNCASDFNHGAWWYNACSYSNLNGFYYNQESYSGNYHGTFWYHWGNTRHRSLAFTEMKFRRKN